MNNYTKSTRRWTRLMPRLGWGLILILSLLWLPGPATTPQVQASPLMTAITVTTTADDVDENGNCTLREAVIAANDDEAVDACPAGDGADTIILGEGTYALTLSYDPHDGDEDDHRDDDDDDEGWHDPVLRGRLEISHDLTITGAGAGVTIIDASQINDRAFRILYEAHVTLAALTVTAGEGTGGGIYNKGTFTLNEGSLEGNTDDHGDGGGGLKNRGTAVLNNSTVSNNASTAYGGGIYNSGTLTLNNSTVSGNSAGENGGGIKNESALFLNNSTIANNTASHKGGGLAHDGKKAAVTSQNTIVAGNYASEVAYADCYKLNKTTLSYNLLATGTGCPTSETDVIVDPANVFESVLGPLQNNGGQTATHALFEESPAIDAGNPAGCFGSEGPFTTDQRGESRPEDGDGDNVAVCDIGSYEAPVTDPVQLGSTLVVNVAEDSDDGRCSVAHCSLREAINLANARENGEGPDQINFNIPVEGEQPPTISPNAALPLITDPVVIDGTSQPGSGSVILNGSEAGAEVNGLTISAGGSTVRGLVITGFAGNGLVLDSNGGNLIQSNTITANGGNGVLVTTGEGNAILGNTIFGNGQLGIDLAGDGITGNDVDDGDTGSNDLQNFPFIFQATPSGENELTIGGRLNSTADTTYVLEFFANPTCNLATLSGERFLGSAEVTISADTNNVYFSETINTGAPVPAGHFVTATATNLTTGSTSEFAPCVAVGLANDIWPRALELNVRGSSPEAVQVNQFIDVPGRSRWYRFQVAPNSKVVVELSELPADYDLFLYNDIQATYDELTNPTPVDVVRLGAEFAPGAPSPGAPSPGAPSPGAPSPGAPSPGAPSLDAYAPGAPSPGAPSPGAPSPGAPSLYDYAPGAPSPGAPSPGAPSPGAPSFSSAETRSFLAASVLDGPVDELIVANTWNNARDFYVRVSGRNGAFDVTQQFRLEVALLPGVCNAVQPLPTGNVTITDGDFETIILTDLNRMEARGVFDLNDPAQVQAMQDLRDPQGSLAAFAAQVNGVIVDVNSYVADLNTQADNNPACPYAKNLVAEALKDLIDDYRDANRDGSGNETLDYIVLVGNDDIIPFFRHPDRTELGNESGYVPPVEDDTASQASLRLAYTLSQDGYGASTEVDVSGTTLPIPDLAVGRLVETPGDIVTMLAAYAASNGLVAPNSALVTGYDFLQDGADAVVEALATQNGISDLNTLIADQNLAPSDPGSWDAAALSNAFLSRRHDLIYLAGHFSANSALAADYTTYLRTTDVTGSPVDLTNAIIYSAGCHSGYNIVNQHGVPQVTFEPDWAQAFAQKGALLIAGTGYQYGDTEFVEYSERLYLNFTRELRASSGPVTVGQALVRAKQDYLAGTPLLRGMHEKALLEATIFGPPMMAVDMPGDPLSPPSRGPLVSSSDLSAGDTTGLSFTDVPISFFGSGDPLRGIDVTNVENGSQVTATWLQGRDGVVTNPGEPVLPRRVENVTVSSTVLRGVALREMSYSDSSGVTPLVGRPATELAPVLTGFTSDTFFPIRPWNVNYFDALSGGGETSLIMTPAQYISDEPGSLTSTRRRINDMRLRLYYSNNLDLAGVDAPSIVEVTANEDVTFTVSVVGDPGAPIEDVWVTYTATSGPFYGRWQSLDLSQTADARYWQGTLPVGETNPRDIRYIVQACNGAGLCTLASNEGAYYIPGGDNLALAATSLALEIPSGSGAFGTQATFSAVLRNEANGSQPLANQPVTFVLGAQRRQALTNGDGRATVSLSLLELPGEATVRATFGGSTDGTNRYLASFDTGSITIVRQGTALTLDPQQASGSASDSNLMMATLTDSTGRPLAEETVFFVITGQTGAIDIPIITNYLGQASLGNLDLPAGSYQVTVYYNGTIPLSTGNSITLTSERYEPAAPVTGSLTLGQAGGVCEIILDDFNRRGKNIGRNWAGASGVGHYKLVDGSEVEALGVKPIFWKSPSFGPDQEACIKLTRIDPKGRHSLLLKVQNVWNRGAIGVYYEPKKHGGVVGIETYEKKWKGWRTLQTFPMQLQAGDQLAAQALSDGTVRVYVNGNLVGEANAGSFFVNKGGRIGLWFISPRHPHARFDDFGGR